MKKILNHGVLPLYSMFFCMPYGKLLTATFAFVLLTNLGYSQSCGQGSFHIFSSGTQVTPFQTTCVGTTIDYSLSGAPNTFPLSAPAWTIIPASAGEFGSSGQAGMTVSVTWYANGTLRVDYPDTGGNQCEEVVYTMTTPSPGTVSGPSSVCPNEGFNLTVVSSNNAGTAVWQKCISSTGCDIESEWETIGQVTGSPLVISNLSATTRFRTRIEYTVCNGGIDYSNEKEVVLKTYAAQNVVISDPGAICPNNADEIVINLISADNVVSGATYEWFRNGMSAPGNSSPTPNTEYRPHENYSLNENDVVILKITRTGYCDAESNAAIVDFVAETFPTFGGISHDPLCIDQPVTFTSGGITGDWRVGTGGFPFTGSTYTINPQFQYDIEGQVVYFQGTVTGSCGTTQPVSASSSPIEFLARPKISASNEQICDGEYSTIIMSGDAQSLDYAWSASYSNASSSISSGTANPISHVLSLVSNAQGKATYTVTATSPDGCVSDVVTVETVVHPRPVNPTIPVSQFCDFQPLVLRGSPNADVVDFKWFDTQQNFLGQGIEHELSIMQPGTYQYKFLSISVHGCESNTLGTITANVLSSCNDELNWIETKTFTLTESDEPQAISHSKSYFDFAGKPLQSQVKSLSNNEILASSSVEDEFGRVVLNTLTAPTNEIVFGYKHWFIRDGENELYNYQDLGNPFGSLIGTVGWYYSVANNKESNVPLTQHPYKRVDYYEDGSNEIRMNADAGEAMVLGSNHEILSGTFPVYNELDDYLSKRLIAIPGIIQDASLRNEAVQKIVRDQNGKYSITITDKAGKSVMSARSGYVEDPNNLPNNVHKVTNEASATVPSNTPSSLIYFYIMENQPVELEVAAGTNYEVENIITGTEFLPPQNGTEWTAGFYRIVLLSGSITVTYYNHFFDVSYQFYDDANRLRVSLSPNGITQMKANGNQMFESSTESAVELVPVVDLTLYNYNQRGWLLSMKEPDAGETQYIYRKDGKIKFSQNAKQRSRNHFSYTHYDQAGRAVESGEYIGTIPFIPMYDQSFEASAIYNEIEKSSEQTSWNNLVKRDWVFTKYDEKHVAVNAPISQDFLRGAVAYTENINAKTWYSYDELGRVVSMAQKPKMLPLTFIAEYSYDVLGNVLTVKNSSVEGGQIRDVFYHHYTYDADQRLFQAFTSADGTNKKLRATYEYYLHGPLKRIELGEKLQGIDFVYNINGWLTQINHPDKDQDPGKDGLSGGEHAGVRPDVFGMVLDYYESDMTGLYAAGSGPAIQNLHQLHGLPFSNQNYANHQPLIRFDQITDPSSVTHSNLMKQYSAENPRYKELLSSD